MNAAQAASPLSRRVPRPDGITFARFTLLVLAVTSLGDGLAELIRGIASNPNFLLSLFGNLAGWQLARSRWNAWISAAITLLSGLIILLLTVGGLAAPLWALATAILTIKLVPLGQSLDISRIVAAWGWLDETLVGLLEHLSAWSGQADASPIVSDPLMLGLLWGYVIWLLAGWAAWMVRRHSVALPALLPGLALLAWASYYTNSRQSLFELLLVGVELVALQVLQNYYTSHLRLQAARQDQVEETPGLMSITLSLSVVLLVVGALTPSLSVKQIALSIARSVERGNDRLAGSLGLQPTPGDGPGQAGVTGSSNVNSLIVSAGPNLSTEVVMTVAVDGYRPPPEETRLHGEAPEPPIRYYWRSQTFDIYTGRGWGLSPLVSVEVDSGENIQPDDQFPPEYFQLITQYVTRRLPGQAVHVTGEMLTLDQPATVRRRSPGDVASASTETEWYIAESLVPLATVEILRQAGSDYPQEIRQYYLQLPDGLSERVRSLAFEITASQANPYDRAAAIEAYLRQYPYTLDVPAPSDGREVADFFLFDLQKGYCDYYATTMVVLARIVGLPSRLVTGYSRGSYDEAAGVFIVRRNNAHAWVEVFFPGAGWIEFEPTAGRPVITRFHAANAPPAADLPPVVPAPPGSSALARWWRGLDIPSGWLAAAGTALLLALLVPLEGWLLQLQGPERAQESIQQRLYRLGHHWDLRHSGALTPYEFSGALAASLESFAEAQRYAAILPALRRDLDWLTGLYVCSLYAGHAPSRLECRKAVRSWLNLKYRLLWLRLRS